MLRGFVVPNTHQKTKTAPQILTSVSRRYQNGIPSVPNHKHNSEGQRPGTLTEPSRRCLTPDTRKHRNARERRTPQPRAEASRTDRPCNRQATPARPPGFATPRAKRQARTGSRQLTGLEGPPSLPIPDPLRPAGDALQRRSTNGE